VAGAPRARRLSAPAVRWRSVALPIEHGAWGFLLEPALLGLLVAASAAGVALVTAALAALLLQTPLSLVLTDLRRGRRYPRTALAWRFVALYGAALLLALALALTLAGTVAILLPAAIAAPLVAVQLWYDARSRARELLPEAAGAVAMGALAACVALAGGWSLLPALGLWALLAARTVPAIVYVRARLRLERGQSVARAPTWASHALAWAVVAAAAAAGAVAWLVTLPYAVLTARAALGLSSRRVGVPAKVIGFREIGYGIMVVVVVAVAVRLPG
jgi:hypothetical protein